MKRTRRTSLWMGKNGAVEVGMMEDRHLCNTIRYIIRKTTNTIQAVESRDATMFGTIEPIVGMKPDEICAMERYPILRDMIDEAVDRGLDWRSSYTYVPEWKRREVYPARVCKESYAEEKRQEEERRRLEMMDKLRGKRVMDV